jgi:hypothetical protein
VKVKELLGMKPAAAAASDEEAAAPEE